MAISLMVHYGGKASLVVVLLKVVLKIFCVKLPAVIKYHSSGYIVPRDDVLPDKFSNFSRSDEGHSLGLYPLAKVIDCHKQVLALSSGLRERTQDVHALFSKG